MTDEKRRVIEAAVASIAWLTASAREPSITRERTGQYPPPSKGPKARWDETDASLAVLTGHTWEYLEYGCPYVAGSSLRSLFENIGGSIDDAFERLLPDDVTILIVKDRAISYNPRDWRNGADDLQEWDVIQTCWGVSFHYPNGDMAIAQGQDLSDLFCHVLTNT